MPGDLPGQRQVGMRLAPGCLGSIAPTGPAPGNQWGYRSRSALAAGGRADL